MICICLASWQNSHNIVYLVKDKFKGYEVTIIKRNETVNTQRKEKSRQNYNSQLLNQIKECSNYCQKKILKMTGMFKFFLQTMLNICSMFSYL